MLKFGIADGGVKDLLRSRYLPFNARALEKHAASGGYAIIRPSSIPYPHESGARIVSATMSSVYEASRNRLGEESSERVLFRTYDYQGEPFFKQDPLQATVALVTGVIPGSTSKSYLGQIELIPDYLRNEAYSDQDMPYEYKEAIEEFEGERLSLSHNSQKAALALFESKLIQMTMLTPGEFVFDSLVRQANNRGRLMEGLLTSTKSRTRGSDMLLADRIVSVGWSHSRGILLSYADLGKRGDPGVGLIMQRYSPK